MHRLRGLGRGPIVIGAVAGAAVIGVVAWALLRSPASNLPLPSPSASISASAAPSASASVGPTTSPSTPAVADTCPLNGLPLDDPSVLTKTAIAVQIENNPIARPQRNLSNADFVVEAPVEGDTTRFSAVFLCRKTKGVTGPVRSSRYYEIDLWQDLHVLPVGFGASGAALSRFAAAGMPYVNGITGSWPWFARHGSNPAPHNLFADLEALRAEFGKGHTLDRYAARTGKLRPQFTFDTAADIPVGHVVTAVEIKTNAYWRFGWKWSGKDRAWLRQDAGKQLTDAVTGDPVSATAVVVQRVREEVVFGDPDPGGNTRRLQHLVGAGDGTLYLQEQAIALHWSRPTAADGTTWTYVANGQPVVLPPGVVWWEIVPVKATVTEN